MPGYLRSPQKPSLVTARQARLMFRDAEYVDAMKMVNNAILAAAGEDHRVTLDIPTGQRVGQPCVAYHVANKLRENGFDVIMIHDSENGSSELTVDWSHIVGD